MMVLGAWDRMVQVDGAMVVSSIMAVVWILGNGTVGYWYFWNGT